MKITKKDLKRIIKEEFQEATISEAQSPEAAAMVAARLLTLISRSGGARLEAYKLMQRIFGNLDPNSQIALHKRIEEEPGFLEK